MIKTQRIVLAALALALFSASATAAYALSTGGFGGPAREPGATAAELVAAFGGQGSSEQQAALADGVVRREEFESAMAAYAACGEAAGFTALVTPGKGLRVTRVNFQIPAEDPSAEALGAALAVLEDCEFEHSSAVQAAWALQQGTPSQLEVAALYDWLEACLAGEHEPGEAFATGGTIYPTAPEDRAFADISPQLRALYMRCAAEAEALTGLKAPPPFSRPDGLPRP